MHAECHQWVSEQVEQLGLSQGKTLEVGSFRVNGDATLRHLFSDYLGTDMRAGENVDVVANAHSLPFPDDEFDTVVCVNTLEHDRYPARSLKKMYGITKPGGHLLLGVPGFGFPLHEHPCDYWRFSSAAVELLVSDAGYAELDVNPDTGQGGGWFCLAKK